MAINPVTLSKTLTYQTQAVIPAITQDLREIAELDQRAEAQQKKFGWLLGISIAVSFLSFFLLVTGIGAILLVLSIVGDIYFGYQYARHGHLNVDNRRYELVNNLLTMLGRDLEPDSNIEITIVLNSPTDKSKKVDTKPHPMRSGWKVDYYEDSWLKLRGRFSDGTRFLLAATELNQTAYGWKRGRSGKSKYKTKTKCKGTELALTLTYSQRKYGAIKVLEDAATGAIKLPAQVRLKRMKITERGMFLQTFVSSSTSSLYQTITMMFLSLYQVLNLARMLSKPKQA